MTDTPASASDSSKPHNARASTPSRLVARVLIAPPACVPIWTEPLLLAARLYAGITIAGAGLDKLPAPDWMTDQVTQIGFPAPAFFALAACFTEFAAGALLALGLFTRPAALLLAWTMGVASFAFHGLTPILDMHIAQGFVWLFVVYLALGGGRLSIDALINCFISDTKLKPKHALLIAAALATPVLAYGVYRQLTPPPPQPETEATTDLPEIETVALTGKHNGWSLATDELTLGDDNIWRGTIDFQTTGPTPIKIAANGSWDLALGAPPNAPTYQLPAELTGDPNGNNIIIAIETAGPHTIEVDPATFTIRIAPPE